MAQRLDRLVPPGLDWRRALRRLAWFLAGLSVWSLFYLNVYGTERASAIDRSLQYPTEAIRAARGVEYLGLQPFWSYARGFLIPFLFLALLCLANIRANYARCRTLSRSDYTLRRLRDPWEYHRRCLALPLLEALICLLAFALVTGIYFLVYLRFTPAELLPPAGQRFWG